MLIDLFGFDFVQSFKILCNLIVIWLQMDIFSLKSFLVAN